MNKKEFKEQLELLGKDNGKIVMFAESPINSIVHNILLELEKRDNK